MLSRLVHFSLRHVGLVAVMAVLLMGYGAFVTRHSALDAFPEFVPPQVDIQTEAPGLAPEQVEQLVTRPVEAAVMGAVGLESVRSESLQGLSVITAVFKEGTNVFQARQNLSERLAELSGQLATGVKAPKMSPLTSSTMDLLKIGLKSAKLTPRELRTFADWTLRPRLQAVPGVAKVTVYGGQVRQLQIQVDTERLRTYDLGLTDVLTAVRLSTGVRGAGFIETGNQRLTLETQGQTLTAEALAQTLVARSVQGTGIHLGDVAAVVEGAEPMFGDAHIMGGPGVLLALASQYGANTLEVTQVLEAALAEMKPLFEAQGIEVLPGLHRPATFIENALANVSHALALGGLFVAIVLLLFLRDWRTALISFMSIPLSLLSALMVLHHFGVTLNTMTLGGLAVAVGVVVDDAIIDVENILRRLRENSAMKAPRTAVAVILEASLEVRSAVVYATFVVVVVFVPVLALSGIQGKFFAPLALAFILATLASLMVALTVTPALCLLLLRRHSMRGDPWWLRGLRRVHEALLGAACARPLSAAAAAFLMVLAALMTLPWFHTALLPEFREGHFVAGVTTLPGMSLPEMMRLGDRISAELLQHDRVATVEQQAGRAEQGEDTWGPHRCEFHIELKPGPAAEEAAVQEDIRRILAAYPGTQSEVLTFLGDRIGETLTGETAQVVVQIFGDDLDALDRAAREIAAELRAVPGAVDVQMKSSPGAPRLVVRLKPEVLLARGYHPVDVLETVQLAYQGAEAAQVFDGARVEPVSVILNDAARADPRSLGALLISNAEGTRLPLSDLADVFSAPGRYSLFHEGARRLQTVTCNVSAGTDVGAFVKAARRAVSAKVALPVGTYSQWNGIATQAAAARQELLLHAGIAGVVILLMLGGVFSHFRHMALVLANVPFALVGGLLAALASGGVLSIGSLVGLVTLFGISMRNSIMMISHLEHLVQKEGAPWCVETVRRAARERFLPIVMTALVTALGLLPLTLGSGQAGSEIEGPIAVVILGGLVSSTVLNLIVLPAMAWRWGRVDAEISPPT